MLTYSATSPYVNNSRLQYQRFGNIERLKSQVQAALAQTELPGLNDADQAKIRHTMGKRPDSQYKPVPLNDLTSADAITHKARELGATKAGIIDGTFTTKVWFYTGD
jgi:transcriptional regulator with AAA-type ATPase domain